MRFNVIYGRTVPKKLKKELKELFSQFRAIVPKWLEDIYVEFSPISDEDQIVLAEIETQYEYRKVIITVYPEFLFEEQDNIYGFVHELMHAFYGNVYNYSHRTFINVLLEQDLRLQTQVLGDLRMHNEASTQDLTNMVFSLMGLDKRTGKRIGKRKKNK